MAFEGLTEKLTNAFNRLRGKGRLTEADVREAMREVKLALTAIGLWMLLHAAVLPGAPEKTAEKPEEE